MVTIIALVIGIMILAAGLYYYSKEKNDRESAKIYITIAVIGAVITAATILKLVIIGM